MNTQFFESSIENSKYHDFVVFTSTFYKDDVEWKVRSEACFEMLDNTQKLWIRVVVGDGGSGVDFLERVSGYPNVTLIHSGKWWENTDLTMAGERRFTGRVSMEKYPEASYFLWLEPEKAELMKMENIDAILDPMRLWTADMVVPSRKSKDTLPPQQRAAENRANRRASDIINIGDISPVHEFRKKFTAHIVPSQRDDSFSSDKVYRDNEDWENADRDTAWSMTPELNAPYDLWFGPKAFTRSSMEDDFLSYKWAKWDGIITSVLAGKMRWKNVRDIPVDFTYPPKQTELETDLRQAMKYQTLRRSQYRYIIKTIKKLVAQI